MEILLFKEAYIQYLSYIENRQKFQSKRSLKERFGKKILPFWKDYNIYNITETDFISWQNLINLNSYSNNYLKNLHYLISGFFKYCMKFHGLSKNVANIVGCFQKKYEQNNHDFYTYKEFKKFIKQFNKEDYIYKEFFYFMYFTGLRPGEVMALNFKDLKYMTISINKTIDEHCDPITKKREIGTPKTHSSYRTVKLDIILYIRLIKLKKYYINNFKSFNTDYFVFGGIKPLSPTTINRYKEKACNKAKMRKIKLHQFRHSHASLLHRHKVDIIAIKERLGHSNISTTNIYVHLDKSQEKRVTRTLNLIRLFHIF